MTSLRALLRLAFVLVFATPLLTMLATSVAPSVAHAQTTPKIREELPEKWRKNWDAAGDLFDDGNYEAALVEYQRIYTETQNPRVLFNIGVCWKERKYYAQAARNWEKQLAARDKLPKAEVERAENALETVRQFVTTLDLSSNQSGATLVIKDIEIGTTPFSAPIPIDVGPNTIALVKQGFARVERTVEVQKDSPVKLVLNMVPAEKTTTATIAVSGATGATIYIDGTEMGPAPFKGEVPTGRHTFEARLKGYLPGVETSEVAYGEPLRLTLALRPELKEGKIRIRTGQADAVISVDGEVKGSGTWEGLLPEGGHRVAITKDGYKTRTEEVALVANQERVVDLTLEADQSSSWIYWTVTSVLVAAGAATTCYFVFRPAEGTQVSGTLSPGVVPTVFSF
ncbi:MAG: PEGA domain-containing protein [Polyangiaceae bacterium]